MLKRSLITTVFSVLSTEIWLYFIEFGMTSSIPEDPRCEESIKCIEDEFESNFSGSENECIASDFQSDHESNSEIGFSHTESESTSELSDNENEQA